MDLAEAVCFSSQLSPSDAQKVEGYLANKWELSGNLTTNHPYKSAQYLLQFSPSQPMWPQVLVNLSICLRVHLLRYPRAARRMFLMQTITFPYPCGSRAGQGGESNLNF